MRMVLIVIACALLVACWPSGPECDPIGEDCPDESPCALGACQDGVCIVRHASEGSPGKCGAGLVCIGGECAPENVLP